MDSRILGVDGGLSAEKVMVVTTQRWPLAARISIALRNVGFRVAAVSEPGNIVRTTRAIEAHYDYRPGVGPESLACAIDAWSPDLLVCSDDLGVRDLHRLHRRAARSDGQRGAAGLRGLIERSLGDPAGYSAVGAKSQFMVRAKSMGIRCPATTAIHDAEAFDRELETMTYPIVVKADGSWGGSGVRIVKNERQARRAFAELTIPETRRGAIGRSLRRLRHRMPGPRVDWQNRDRRTVSVEQYISGRPANRAVVCSRGKVLAGISVEAIETFSECGPATVVKIIDQPEMTAAAEMVVSGLKLSGFIGLDFVLDLHGKAWLIEMNARVTPICHLCLVNGTNLTAAAYSHFAGKEARQGGSSISERTIALFPSELQRCPNSEYLATAYHDVPLDEPELVRACLEYYASKGFLRRKKVQMPGIAGL